MKRQFLFLTLSFCILFTMSCGSNGGCPPTNGAGNGQMYIIHDSNGQPIGGGGGTRTGANGQVQIPCGGSAHPVGGGPVLNQQ